jgi:hypothetical protein
VDGRLGLAIEEPLDQRWMHVDGGLGLAIEKSMDKRWMPLDGLKIVVDPEVL